MDRISKDTDLMGKMQKKIQLELAFMKEMRGEPPEAPAKGGYSNKGTKTLIRILRTFSKYWNTTFHLAPN